MIAALSRKASGLVTVAVFGAVLFGVPIFEVRNGNWPTAGMPGRLQWPALRSGAYVDQMERRLGRRSKLDDVVLPYYREAEYWATGRTAPGVVVGPDDWLFAAERMRAPSTEERESLVAGVGALGGVIRKLEAGGTRVVIELSPRKPSLFPGRVPKSYVPRSPSDYQFVLQALRAQGLTAPDLRPAMLEGGVMRFLTNDVHWNGDGTRAGARTAAVALRGRMGDGPLPGPAFVSEIVAQRPRPFRGRQQRELGLRPNSALYRRFLDEDRPLFVMREGRKRAYRPVREPRPIVVIGSSMSTGTTTTAAMLSHFLGVEVEDRARPGFDYSYRLAGLMGEIWTGRRAAPKALVLEFPEDFPLYEGRYFFEPLEVLRRLQRRAPYSATVVPFTQVRLKGVRRKKGEGGNLEGSLLQQNSSLTWPLPEPVPCNAGAAVSFGWTFTGGLKYRTDMVVEWLGEGNGQILGRRRVHIGQSRWLHPIQVSIEGRSGQRVGAVRVRPCAPGNTFECAPLEVWLPAAPR